jgi:NAD+ synthase (glutamine-hydrolysing)
VAEFFNLYRHGFARVAVATPIVRIGDPAHNLEGTAALMQQAARERPCWRCSPSSG